MVKNGKVKNISCLKCGKIELRSFNPNDAVIILKEWDD
jgi:hypothetical protein